MKIFQNLEDMKPFYDEQKNTYDLTKVGFVKVEFDLDIESNIDACELDAKNIKAWNIRAEDIVALDIKARDIMADDVKAWNIRARDVGTWDIDAKDIEVGEIRAKNINVFNFSAREVLAMDIHANKIEVIKKLVARDIEARNISYYTFCISAKNIKCKSIKSNRKKSVYKALDGKIVITG